MDMTLDEKKATAAAWFRALRDQICREFEAIEDEYANRFDAPTANHPEATHGGKFARTAWTRPDGGSGEMSIMKGRVFEKVGVNISVVEGTFSEPFRHEIPGAAEDPIFWAAGISLVAHMASPLVRSS